MRAKAGPTLGVGVFMGYRLPPRGRWAGDYLVMVDLDKFSGLSMHTDAEPGLFAKCRPQITRTVKWTKHGFEFPLFDKLMKHNEIIEGVDLAILQMARERRRRKKMKLTPMDPEVVSKLEELEKTEVAKKLKQFGETKRTKDASPDAGFDVPPSEETHPYNGTWATKGIGASTNPRQITSQQCRKEKEQDLVNEAATSRVGQRARVTGPKKKSRNNGMVTMDCWEAATQMYECRFDSDISNIKMDHINPVVFGETKMKPKKQPGQANRACPPRQTA